MLPKWMARRRRFADLNRPSWHLTDDQVDAMEQCLVLVREAAAEARIASDRAQDAARRR